MRPPSPSLRKAAAIIGFVTERPHVGSDAVIRTVGQLVGLAAGLLALVYAAGGGVLALRLYLAHLPSRTIVGQLPRDLVISFGLTQVVLPVLAVVAVYAGYRLLRGTAPPPRMLVQQWTHPSTRASAELIGASVVPAFAVAAAIAFGADSVRGGSGELLWLTPVQKLAVLGFLITALVMLVGLNVRARLVREYGTPENVWSTRRPIVLMTLLVGLASVPVCVFLSGAFFPLLDAKVCTSRSAVKGVLIGETSDRTYIGEANRPKAPLLVFSVPSSQIKWTFIGGNADLRPCSKPNPG